MFAIPAILALSFQSAQEVTTSYSLRGTSIGTNTTKRTGSSFDSVSEISVGITIKSRLTGTFKEGKLTEFKLVESAGPNSGEIEYKGGKINIIANGKKAAENRPFTLPTPHVFSNWHPVLWSTLRPPKGAASLKIFPINAMTPIDAKVSLSTVIGETPTGAKSLDLLKMDLGGTGTEFLFEDNEAVALRVESQGALFVRKGYEKAFRDPLAAYPELSQPVHAVETITTEMATMRDGVKLATTVIRPKEAGTYPAILIRTPYGRATSALSDGTHFASRGYVVVCQDVRGRGDSEGDFDPFLNEIEDGKDTLDWIVAQKWSNGKVGMIGASYLGLVQWAATISRHPALKCIIPQVSPPEPTRNIPWENGEFLLLASIWWARIVADKNADMSQIGAALPSTKSMSTLPLHKVDDVAIKRDLKFFNLWLQRDTLDRWPGAISTSEVAKTTIPVMHVSGFWDGDGIGTKLHYEAIRKNNGNQWLIFGPWDHFFNTKSSYQGVNYGPNALLELDSVYLRFFDAHLKDKEVKLSAQSKVRFFVGGSNRWIHDQQWPPKSAKRVSYFLGGSKANGYISPGVLTSKPANRKYSYRYDPNKKSVEIGAFSVTEDRGALIMKKKDLNAGGLVFRTPVQKRSFTLTGVEIRLNVSTTARDASFHTYVFDERPDGKLQLIGLPGKMRVTYRNGAFEPLKPKQIYQISVDPWWFAHEIKAGHRLVVGISSDAFPGVARNPGTGERVEVATKLIAATHTVHSSKDTPSTVSFYKL